MFKHGVYTKEKESSEKAMATVTNPIFVVGTAPINMGDISNIDKVQLITNKEEAVNIFGGFDVPGFTITETLELAFQKYNVKPIICVNVLNPKKHSSKKEEKDIVVISKKVLLEELGIIKSTLVLEDATSETAKEINANDYTANFLITGELVISIFNPSIKKINAKYDWLDPSLVTELDIIGGVELGTTNRTGLECVNDVMPIYKMVPSVAIAPGYDSKIEVIQALYSKSISISDKYQCMSIGQLPEDILYSESIAKKTELNCIYPDMILTYGKLKNGNKIYHHSTQLACLMSSVDNKNGGVPYESPSNKLLAAQALVMKKNDEYVEIRLEEVSQANLLNENGISTAISRNNGFVHWGNRTASFQPGGNMDPKDMWIPSKRMFKFIANTIIINTDIEIDKPMDYYRASFITRNLNMWLDGLTAAGKLYGGRVEFTEDENPTSNIIDGKFTWHVYLGTINPLESAHFILEYDQKYQQVIFKKAA